MWELFAEPNEESNPGLEKFWGEVIDDAQKIMVGIKNSTTK
jgi:hypothetical protein